MSSAGPRCPNQQLNSVGVETYFSGRFSAVANLPLVQDRFGDRLPNLWVPNSKDGAATDLQPYQLRDDAQTEALAIAINQVAYVCLNNYPGYAAFSESAVDVLTETLGLLGVTELQRVAYRYKNEIGISRDDEGLLPIDRILELSGLPKWCGLGAYSALDIGFSRPWDHGSVGLEISVEGSSPQEVLRVAIVAMYIPAGPCSDLAKFTSDAHDEAFACFDGMITSGFRAFLESEESDHA